MCFADVVFASRPDSIWSYLDQVDGQYLSCHNNKVQLALQKQLPFANSGQIRTADELDAVNRRDHAVGSELTEGN